MFEKAKLNLTHRRLKIVLLGFIAISLLAAWRPLIWIKPPYWSGETQINPINMDSYLHLTIAVYIIISLLWLPYIVWIIRRLRSDRFIKLLIPICVLATLLLAGRMMRYTNVLGCSKASGGSPVSNFYNSPVSACNFALNDDCYLLDSFIWLKNVHFIIRVEEDIYCYE